MGVHCKFTNRDNPSSILDHDVFFPRQVHGLLSSRQCIVNYGARIKLRVRACIFLLAVVLHTRESGT